MVRFSSFENRGFCPNCAWPPPLQYGGAGVGATAGVIGGTCPVMDAFGTGPLFDFSFALLASLRGLKCRPRHLVTVAILAQGTSWAVAVTQAFLYMLRAQNKQTQAPESAPA